MDKKINYKIFKQMNHIDFLKLKDYKCGSGLYVVNYLFSKKEIDRMTIQQLMKEPILSNEYDFKNQKGKKLFVFSTAYLTRNEYREYFDRLTELFSEKMVLNAKNRAKKINFSLEEKILLLIWLIQMRKIKCSIKEKLVYCNYMMCALRSVEIIKKIIDENNVKVLITFCDVHVPDYFMTQYCNKKGIKTVTLQHGIFGNVIKKRVYQYQLSPSQYFLTFGEWTKKRAVDLGVSERKVIPLGILYALLNTKLTERNENYDKNRFLIVLNGDTIQICYESNIKMIEIGKKIAEKFDMQFDVKPHPSTNSVYITEYKNVIGNKGRILSKNSLSKKELFDKYEFGIFHFTTMVFEAIYQLMPVYLYYDQTFTYQDIDFPYFSDLEEFLNVRNWYEEDKKYLSRMREYLCGAGDITENYIKFLNGLEL